MAFNIGQKVWIRCKVQPGPFSDELLVTVESLEGPVTGFVNSDELKQVNGQDLIRGVVRSMASDRVEVWIKGSFFTTSGLASVPPDLAVAA